MTRNYLPLLRIAVASTILASGIFLLDISLPLGVAGGVPYVAVILVGWWFKHPRHIFILAAVCTVLTGIGYLLSTEAGIHWMVVTNRILALFSIWVTAVLLAVAKRSEQALRRSHDELEQRIHERTLQLQNEISEREQTEASRRESDERLRSFMDSATDAFYLFDAGLNLIDLNKTAVKTLGVDKVDLVGRNLAALFPDSRESGRYEKYLAVVSTGEPISLDHRVIRPTKETADVSVKAFPVGFGLGIISSDITERKRAEDELRRSQGQLETVFNTVPHSLWIKDRNFRYLKVNSALAANYNLSTEDFEGLTTEDTIVGSEEDRAKFVATDRQVFESGERVELPELIVTLPSGERRLRHVIKLPLRDEHGNVTGLVGISEDITERKQAEDELRESEAKYRTLIEQASDGIYITDTEGKYSEANLRGCELLGCSQEELLRLNVRDFVPPEEMADFDKRNSRLIAGEPILFERHNHRIDGFRFPVEISATTLSDGRTLAIVRDITERKRSEQALRESQRLLQTMFDSIPQLIAVKDKTGRYKSVNRAFSEAFQRSPEELVGKLPSDLKDIDESALQAAMKSDQQVLRTGDSIADPKKQIRLPNGKQRTYYLRKVPLLGEGGEVEGVVSINHDITELEQAHEELRESQRLLQTVFDTVPNWLFVKDRSSRYRIVNRSMAEFFKLRPEEFVDKTFREIGTDIDEITKGEEGDRTVLETKTSVTIPEMRVVAPDGSYRYRHVIKLPLMDEAGNVAGIVSASEDITERKRAEQALRESQRLLQTVIESIPLGIFVKDTGRRFLIENKRSPIVGLMESNIIGKTNEETNLFSAENCRQAYEEDESVLNNGATLEIPLKEFLSSDGIMRQYRLIKTPLRDNEGNVTGLVGIREDITDRITLENALRDAQKMEAVGQLAGGVAHDFNNMMQIIINYAHFAVEEVEDTSKVRGFLDQILRAGKRATNLTRQLLAYSRKSIIRPKILNLNQLAANLIGMLDVVIGENIALQLNSAAGLHPVRADPGMLEQVIINLCVNARDAMPDGGSLVIETQDFHAHREFCDAHGWEKPGDYVMLSVRDNGVGMTPELRERIFEPFFTSKEVGQGTGLGLAMAYGIIRQHNGRIEVSSKPGAGSTFRIYLPRANEAADSQAQQADAVDSGGSGVTLGGRV